MPPKPRARAGRAEVRRGAFSHRRAIGRESPNTAGLPGYDPGVGLTAGERFAGFRIIRPLGAGGMGEVYLVEHPRLPRLEALKVLSAELSLDAEYRQRFAREADLAAKLWHPHIVEVRDRGESGGQLWISMAYVDGQDAGRLLAQKYPAGMPADEVIPIVSAVAAALDYAHGQGTLHRDVKPANIFLSAQDADGQSRVLLGDFGIARDLADPAGMTATGMTLGTLAYSAPEQLNGDPLDGRADQYALAATAYHLLAGTPLFPVTNPVAAISRHLTAPPPQISATHPDLAPMDDVLDKALSKNPDDRYPRCGDFAQALAAAASGAGLSASAPTQQAPVPPPLPARAALPTTTRQGRRWLLPAVLGAAVALLAGILLAKPWAGEPAAPGADPTKEAAGPVGSQQQSVTPGGPAVPPRSDPDLGLDVAISRPSCDGTGIVVLDSATTPGRYQQDIARALANNPGAAYLRTDLSCPSLRQLSDDGNPIYAVYRTAGTTTASLCAAVAAAGPGTYGRWLDTTSDPDTPVECPKTPAADAITDAIPADYLAPGRSDFYLWAYSVSPLRECGIFELRPNTAATSFAVSCDARFPPGTTAPTWTPGLGNEANLVRIIPPKGPEIGTGEGGALRGRTMPPNHRIKVGEISCTTLPDNGVECSAPTGRFRIEDGALVEQS